MGDLGSNPGSRRSPAEGNGYPLQYSCLENSMERGVWWATIHGVAKSQTRLNNSHTLSLLTYDVEHVFVYPFVFHYFKILLPNLCGDDLLWDSAHFCDFLAFICFSFVIGLWKLPGGGGTYFVNNFRYQMELIRSLPLFWKWAENRSLASQRIQSSDHSNCFKNRHLPLASNDTWQSLH